MRRVVPLEKSSYQLNFESSSLGDGYTRTLNDDDPSIGYSMLTNLTARSDSHIDTAHSIRYIALNDIVASLSPLRVSSYRDDGLLTAGCL